jgi:WhiB family redox-sensing transcriptional regulator
MDTVIMGQDLSFMDGIHAEAWMRDASCAQIGCDDDLWFQPGPNPVADRVCAECPIRAECLAYAVAIPSLEGVWAGTSFKQRQRLRRQTRVVAPRG